MPEPIPPPPREPLLSVQDLHVSFHTDEGVVRAVNGLSFDLRPGRTLGVVGESGCGKSVTARAILRIEDKHARIDSGRILLSRDNQVKDLATLSKHGPEMRGIRGRDISLVFQEPMTSFSPVHTIGDQIVETIRLHMPLNRAAARRRAIEQLAQIGTPHPEFIMGQYAWELSGGLRQRAMIAMALVCGPSVLIADEPTTALDVTTQAQVLDLLGQLRDSRAMALLLITHDLGVIAETADDVVVMYLGRVVEQGAAAEIFHSPKHPYTEALLHSMPNPLARPRTRLSTLRGSVPHPLAKPPGCPFHPRCARAISGLCDHIEPAPRTVGPGHVAACHLYADVAADGALRPEIA